MSDLAATQVGVVPPLPAAEAAKGRPALEAPSSPLAAIVFFGFLAAGVVFMA
jgi:hypothetical protein